MRGTKGLLPPDTEGRDEAVHCPERECVHPAVAGGGERERIGRCGKGVERLRADERAVGHDDEGARSRTLVAKCERDRIRVARARVPEDVDSAWGEARVGRHE